MPAVASHAAVVALKDRFDYQRLVARVFAAFAAEGHSIGYAEALCAKYLAFIALKIEAGDFDATKFSPGIYVDVVWHLHILDTREYALMCGDTFVHHDPTGAARAGAGAREARFVAMQAAYLAAYGHPFWTEHFPFDSAADLVGSYDVGVKIEPHADAPRAEARASIAIHIKADRTHTVYVDERATTRDLSGRSTPSSQTTISTTFALCTLAGICSTPPPSPWRTLGLATGPPSTCTSPCGDANRVAHDKGDVGADLCGRCGHAQRENRQRNIFVIESTLS